MFFVSLFFSLHGRISRSEWWLAIVVGGIGNIVIAVTARAAIARYQLSPDAFTLVLLGIAVWSIWLNLCIGAKRWRDVNRPGWYCILALIPFVNFYAFYVYGFVRVTGPNQAFKPIRPELPGRSA